MKRFWASAEQHIEMRRHLGSLNSREDILDQAWQFQDGALTGWHGYINRFAGYAQSGRALAAVHRELCKMGVKFHLGPGHEVVQISYNKVSSENGSIVARGVETANGTFRPAKLVIVAAGAWVSQLIPDIGSQVVAKSWSVAHVELTDNEVSALRNIPVTYARDLGFFFEPDPETKLLKLCPMGGGYINSDTQTGVSLPPKGLTRSAFMPEDDERKVRQLLGHTLPALAKRPLVNNLLCWFADTSDSNFIIDYVPGTSSSVIVMSGDSGHGFKMFPIVGSWITDLLNAKDGKQHEARWRWKTPTREEASSDWGQKVSWRVGETKEFSSIEPTKSSRL